MISSSQSRYGGTIYLNAFDFLMKKSNRAPRTTSYVQFTPDLRRSIEHLKGIVTKMVLKTFPQGQVWGGPLSYTADQVDSFNAATLKFTQEVTDPKAQLITSYIFSSGVVWLSVSHKSSGQLKHSADS